MSAARGQLAFVLALACTTCGSGALTTDGETSGDAPVSSPFGDAPVSSPFADAHAITPFAPPAACMLGTAAVTGTVDGHPFEAREAWASGVGCDCGEQATVFLPDDADPTASTSLSITILGGSSRLGVKPAQIRLTQGGQTRILDRSVNVNTLIFPGDVQDAGSAGLALDFEIDQDGVSLSGSVTASFCAYACCI